MSKIEMMEIRPDDLKELHNEIELLILKSMAYAEIARKQGTKLHRLEAALNKCKEQRDHLERDCSERCHSLTEKQIQFGINQFNKELDAILNGEI